jgi:fructokinase
MEQLNHHPVVCFGEVLWDILPGGKMPGGAPVNVAYHLHKLGKQPALITKVGQDEEGAGLVKIFSGYGLCTTYFQVDDQYETGKVFGKPNEFDEMVYDIVAPSAWDHINWDAALEQLVSNSAYFVFGSLACRNQASEASKDTLLQLLQVAQCRVLDINLRAPYYNRRLVTELLQNCDIVKLNLSELELITGWFSTYSSIEDRIKVVQEEFGIDTIIITMGANGALLNVAGCMYAHQGYPVKVADTVGAGDAFLAGFIKGLLDKEPYQQVLEFASVMGAFTASNTGACPPYTATDIQKFTYSQTINSLLNI